MDALAILGDYTFQNVVLGAALLGVVAGVLGCFALLRQQSLLGDTLSHAALPGICLGFLVVGARELGALLAGALVVGALAGLAVVAIVRGTRLKTDAAMGATLSLSFALGIVLLTFIQQRGTAAQAGLETFLFGQAAALLRSDVWLLAGATVVALALVAAFWKEFKLVSFDPVYARTLGLPVAFLDVLMTVMVALAVVVGLQLVGVVLMAAMVIAPPAAARQWVRSLGGMVALSAAFGILSGVAGAIVSTTTSGLATGPVVVLAASAIALVSLVIAPERGLLSERLRARRLRAHLRGAAVLDVLDRLEREHDRPGYLAEEAMVSTYLETDARRSLRRLEERGLVERREHVPGEGPHWSLTDAGREAAADDATQRATDATTEPPDDPTSASGARDA